MDKKNVLLTIFLVLSISTSGYLYFENSKLNSKYKNLKDNYQEIRNDVNEYETYGNIKFKLPVDSKIEAIAVVKNSDKYEELNQRKQLSVGTELEGNPIDVTYVPEGSNLPEEYKKRINISLPVYGVEFLPITQEDRMSGQKTKFSSSYGFYVNPENGKVKGPVLNDYFSPFP